jgi:hypothetical protein
MKLNVEKLVALESMKFDTQLNYYRFSRQLGALR